MSGSANVRFVKLTRASDGLAIILNADRIEGFFEQKEGGVVVGLAGECEITIKESMQEITEALSK